MKITVAAIADYASISEGGKLNVLGVFDAITAQEFPVRHPHMVFAARLLFEYEDGGKKHAVNVRLEDEDGHKIAEMTGEASVGPVPPGTWNSHSLILSRIRCTE